jgi:predicted membrane protein
VTTEKLSLSQKLQVTPKKLALVAIFSALYYVLSLIIIPQIPTTAGPITISLNALIASVFGIILGPYLGAAAALLGSSITWALTGMSPMGAPFIMAPMFNALICGFVFYRKWKYAFIVFAVMIAAFFFTPAVSPITGQSTIIALNLTISNFYLAMLVVFDKIIALLLILPLALFGKKMSLGYGAIYFFILAFIGNQADNIWGSFIFSFPQVYSGIFNMPLEAVHISFVSSPFLYPAIRLVQAFIATIIVVPLYASLRNTNWLWRKETSFTGKQPQIASTEKQTKI